jgi:hypothetical protein
LNSNHVAVNGGGVFNGEDGAIVKVKVVLGP